MSYSNPENLFALLPKAKTPWTEFVFSTGTQAAAVAFLVWVRLLYPSVVSPSEHTFRSIQLVSTPVPVNHAPQPVPEPRKIIVARVEPPADAVRLAAPQPKAPVKAEVAAPVVNIAAKKLDPLPVDAAPVIPKQAIKTNVFSTGSSVTPTLARAAAQVQTGGFGDPNGVPAKSANEGKAVNIAARGSFDLPVGPGSGNGTGGAKGVPGVVASAGFGGGTATENSRNRTSGVVQAGGFASAEAPIANTARARSTETAARAVPAEIISKPTPVYTQEAKNLRIEGEVQLEVVLEASGGLRVLRVVRGLGHGLDDNAVKAAEQIRFKPAMRDGQPADSTVVLHIVFQIA
jgi:TonB family protein